MLLKLISSKLNLSIKLVVVNVVRNSHFKTRLSVTARDILEPSHGESGTLQGRFIKYIALENCKNDNIVPKTVKYSQFYPLNTLTEFQNLIHSTQQNQLPYVSIFTSTFKTNADPSNVANVITSIDNVCCEKLTNMDLEEIFRNLYSFMYLIPNKITKLKFYQSGVKSAIEKFDDRHSKTMFVQLCYYLGLSKKNKEISSLMKSFLTEYLEIYLNQLNSLDFTIVSNAAYKNSIPFNAKIYQDRLIFEICKNDLDNDLVITLVKSLRLNRIKSDDVIEKLEHEIRDNTRKFDFKGLCHIFAFFAENKYNKEVTCQTFVKHCKDILDSVNANNFIFNDVRPKDLATFLWCCAQLKVSVLQKDDFEHFEYIILEKIARNEYRVNLNELIDTCLSFWMLNYKSHNLLEEVFKMQNSTPTKETQYERVKIDSRFKLLMNLVKIEELINGSAKTSFDFVKSNPFDVNRPAPVYLFNNNKNFSKIHDLIKENQQNLNVKNIKIVQPILELNLPSILIEYGENQRMFLEILDENCKLRFNNEPNAIISLKIKSLLNLKQKVFLVDIEDEETNTIDEIRKLIFQ